MVKQKRMLFIVGVIFLICIFTGITFAYWQFTLRQTNTNIVTTDCFNITFTGNNDINLQKAYPITDNEGASLSPYTFTIENTCEGAVSYQINLETMSQDAGVKVLPDEYLKANLIELNSTNVRTNNLTSDYEVNTTVNGAVKAYKLDVGVLQGNESKTFELRLWLDYDTQVSDVVMNATYNGKISIINSYLDHVLSDLELCILKYGEESIQCGIIALLDDTGACPTVNEDKTIAINSGEDQNSYICSAPDDYGTSYYYRGNVDNNWVKFAGYYWRILRINGDESIRMLYAGDASVIDALENKAEVMTNGYYDRPTYYFEIDEV